MTYQITEFAENDITTISLYTFKRWGIDAVEHYISNLLGKLDAIGNGEVVKEHYKGKLPNIFVTRFRYHLIYYQLEEGKAPLII